MNRREHRRRTPLGVRRRVSASLCALVVSAAVASPEPPELESHDDRPVIKVGVRDDAEPFSYRTAQRSDSAVLHGYGGYMVAICRRVLAQMIVDGPFDGHRVETVPVSAKSRFDDLESEKIDILCGPDSITLARLENYNASHPLFLSGITYVSVDNDKLPQTTYCGSVIGLLESTTAETEGLTKIARSGELGRRFDSVLDAYLAADQAADPAEDDAALARLRALRAQLLDGLPGSNGDAATTSPSRDDPASIRTKECKGGYEAAPVKFYDSHDAGLRDLCRGAIFYYVGDFDIIKRKLANDRSCAYLTRRETLTREHYGVYFRRPETLDERSLRDGVLHAEFSNVLLRKMEAEDVLGYEFRIEFDGKEPSPDLESFFDSFRYATDL